MKEQNQFTLAVFGMWLMLVAGVEADERVLPADQAPVDAPLKAHPDSPFFQLKNLRKEASRFLKNELTVDFERVRGKGGSHEIALVAKSDTGRSEYTSRFFSPFDKSSGTVQCSSGFGLMSNQVGANVEVWLEQHTVVAGRAVRLKVSNSVTMGQVNETSLAREWNAAEQEAFNEWEKSRTPPPAPPAGYVAVATETKLLRGMPVLAGWMAAWEKGEVIDVRSDGNVLVKYEKATEHLTIRPRNWLAVGTDTLRKRAANPKSFEPSIVVLPNGTTPIAKDLQLLSDDAPLVPGVPLKAEWASKWNTVTVLKVLDDGKVRIHWNGWGSEWDENRARSSLLIEKQTLAELSQPDAQQRFAAQAKEPATKTATASRRKLQNYPIRIALPPSAVRVDDKTPLEKGAKLSCNWGNRWEPVTVLDVYDDGAVRIRWDKYGGSWDGDIARDCLIIDKKVLATLPVTTDTPAARTWTDATGRFRIEAILLSVADGKAKLRRTDGREIEVPTSKLSTSDQKVIAEWQAGQANNPFDP